MSTRETSKDNAGSMYGKRQIGQILVDAHFITQEQLECALTIQQTNQQTVGAILGSMEALAPHELQAALSVQDKLGSVQDIIGVAAGSREFLGELLVHAQRITPQQLASALQEQAAGEEKLGDIFVRCGWISENELKAILAFQMAQASNESKNSPLKIGNLLIAAGILSAGELEDAIVRQQGSRQKIGDVLVESGYVKPRELEQGLRLQHKLLGAALSALLCFSAIIESKPVQAAESGKLVVASASAGYSAGMVSSHSAEAQYQLALKYQEGKGVPKDELEAFDLFKAAAEKGHVEAQYALGLLGLDYDDEGTALFWLNEAAMKGHKGAQFAYKKLVNFEFLVGC